MVSDDIRVSGTPPDGWIECVESGVFGSAGARYRRCHVAGQVQRLADPVYLSYVEQQRVIGTCVLDRRQLRIGTTPVQGWYRALLMVAPSHQGQGHGRRLITRAAGWVDEQAAEMRQPALSYGCVDAHNPAPMQALQGNGRYTQVAALSSLLIYRQWPRHDTRLDVLSPDDPRVHVAQDAAAPDCRMADVTPRVAPVGCWLADTGPVMSAHVSVNTIALAQLSPAVRTLAHMLKPLPRLRKRFDPDHFRYLGLGDLTVDVGAEAQFGPFLGALLARWSCHYAMLMLDPSADVYRRLDGAGALRGFGVGTPGTLAIMAGWHGARDTPLPRLGSPHRLIPVDV